VLSPGRSQGKASRRKSPLFERGRSSCAASTEPSSCLPCAPREPFDARAEERLGCISGSWTTATRLHTLEGRRLSGTSRELEQEDQSWLGSVRRSAKSASAWKSTGIFPRSSDPIVGDCLGVTAAIPPDGSFPFHFSERGGPAAWVAVVESRQTTSRCESPFRGAAAVDDMACASSAIVER
jgi:hypothetical protein